jgi:hypothetical protein
MMRYRSLLFVLLLMGYAALAQAADTLEVYDTNTLQKANQIYSENLRLVWNEDLLSRLTDSERQAAENVKLNLPLMGDHRSPFDYHSIPGTREITIPIMSVKFFDDLAIAEAWFVRKECAVAPVSDYVGILRYQGSSLSPGTRFPSPLNALGIPQNALSDAFVNDVSGKTLKSAIYFLMAHELGHVIYQHKPYTMISRQESQAQEIQADEFALNIMRRISVPPVGIVLFFTVCSRVEPAPGDYANPQDYDNIIRKSLTHPLTSQRLMAISKNLRSNADAFSQGQENPALWRPRIIKWADQIEEIGKTLNDPKIRELQKYRGQTIKMENLQNTCGSK